MQQEDYDHDYLDDYLIVKFLGEGSFAKVYGCYRNGECFAAKLLRVKFQNDIQYVNAMEQEANLLQQLNHPNIIKCYYFKYDFQYRKQNGTIKQRVGMILEFGNITLEELMVKYSVLPLNFCRPLFIQLLNGLNYLTQQNICHRDIKPNNIVVKQGGELKIVDFGLATRNDISLYSSVGTKYFQAPEVYFNNESYNGAKADIFSAGKTLFVMVNYPYHNILQTNQYDEFWRQQQIQNNLDFPDSLKNLISGMLELNPENRFTAQQCLQHEWIIDQEELILALEREQFEHNFFNILEQTYGESSIISLSSESTQIQGNFSASNQSYRSHMPTQQRRGIMRLGKQKSYNSLEDYAKYIAKYQLKFDQLKIQKGLLSVMLNQPKIKQDPQLIMCYLIAKQKNMNLSFLKISKRNYKVKFRIVKDQEIKGQIRIELLSLENNLIGVNIAKIEGRNEDFFNIKNNISKFLKQMPK